MENLVKKNMDTMEPIDYELWFQRNYPPLYSNVENAYTEWLVLGQKDLVEVFKIHLDVESQGIDIDEARVSLRGSGTTSLDRSKTVYPVSFIPSNWYRYLESRLAKENCKRMSSGIFFSFLFVGPCPPLESSCWFRYQTSMPAWSCSA